MFRVTNSINEFCWIACLVLRKYKKFSFVLVEGNDSSYWFAEVLLLPHLSTYSAVQDAQEFAFVQYFDLTPAVNKAD